MKKLFFLLCILTAFVACSDNNDNGEPASPIENLKMPPAETPFTTGQSVTIEGKGFTANSQIWLRPTTKATEDIQTKITEVTDNSIVFEVPEGVEGKQSVILKQEGKEYKLGEMTFEISMPNKLFAYKVKENGNQVIKQIVEINPNDGREKIITTLDIPSDYLEYLVYLPSTKEIVANSSRGSTSLIKINTTTGQTQNLNLKDNANWYSDFIADDKENIYAYKNDGILKQIVRLDLKTGNEKSIIDIDINIIFKNLIFNPSTNELIYYSLTVEEGYHKFTVIDIDTQTTKSIPALNYYTGFVFDNKGNLYANKVIDTSDPKIRNNQLVKISLDNGSEQSILSFTDVNATVDLNFFSSNNEIIGILDRDDNPALVKFNLNNLKTTVIELEHLADYSGLITNQ